MRFYRIFCVSHRHRQWIKPPFRLQWMCWRWLDHCQNVHKCRTDSHHPSHTNERRLASFAIICHWIATASTDYHKTIAQSNRKLCTHWNTCCCVDRRGKLHPFVARVPLKFSKCGGLRFDGHVTRKSSVALSTRRALKQQMKFDPTAIACELGDDWATKVITHTLQTRNLLAQWLCGV